MQELKNWANSTLCHHLRYPRQLLGTNVRSQLFSSTQQNLPSLGDTFLNRDHYTHSAQYRNTY